MVSKVSRWSLGGRRLLLSLTAGVAALVVAVDQAAKTWVLHHPGPTHLLWTLRISLQFNTGIAFSQATGSTTFVTVVALAVVGVLVVTAYRNASPYTAAVLGLVIGGAAGNLVDRLIRHHGGAVIDWIDPQWFPVFNVADAAVSVGVVLALAHSFLTARRR